MRPPARGPASYTMSSAASPSRAPSFRIACAAARPAIPAPRIEILTPSDLRWDARGSASCGNLRRDQIGERVEERREVVQPLDASEFDDATPARLIRIQ